MTIRCKNPQKNKQKIHRKIDDAYVFEQFVYVQIIMDRAMDENNGIPLVRDLRVFFYSKMRMNRSLHHLFPMKRSIEDTQKKRKQTTYKNKCQLESDLTVK